MKVSVIGLGYIGLPTATMFASRKIPVLGVDVNARVVDTVNQGKIHIVEPELDMIVHAAVVEGFLRASTTAEAADAFLIAVPTPFKEDHQPDLSYVESAVRMIAPVLEKGNIVILESTSPVGATQQMVAWLQEARPDLVFPIGEDDTGVQVHVAYCPERVLPGQVVRELVENDRIIGGMTPACAQRAMEVYRVFVKGDLITTNARTAEMCKLTENAFRDVNIAFANELSIICGKIGIDVWELIRLANRHPRVNILRPGAGVGGHCIAVDPWFIVSSTPDEARLIRAARETNDAKPAWVTSHVLDAIDKIRSADKPDVTVACYGITFKPDIDDLRESPALQIVEELKAASSATLLAVEPNVQALPASLAGVKKVSLGDALATADIHVILVAHAEFKSSAELRALPVLDFCGALS